MFRIALKNVLARKGRLLLSSLAVIAGCAFLSGVLVFGDTINSQIDKIFATAFEKTDAYVRSAISVEGDFGDETRGQLPETDVAVVQAVDGVKVATADVTGSAIITNAEDEVVGGQGPPQFGANFDDSESSPFTVKEGRGPENGTEVAVDSGAADAGNIEVGETVTISTTTSPREFTVVGIVKFASAEGFGGPTWALFDLKTAQEFVLGQEGVISAISVVGEDGIDQETLRDRIQAEFDPKAVEAMTGQEIIDESQSTLAEQFSFFTTFLTIFALISIFVGSFVIYNVFKISAAQRLRENALLRAIGARSSQVTFALFVEAFIVGLLGAVLGFVGGLGLAFGITAALGLGATDIVISPTTLTITLLTGLIVTLICATFPALRAGRVPPLAAMRDVSVDRSGGSRRRLVVAGVSAALAVAGVAIGLASEAIFLGIGVLAMFVAVIAFGPFAVGRLATLAIKPLGKIRGVTGELAGRNAARSPERTSLTAAALGIGLALLVAVSVLGSSLQSSLRETIGEAFTGEIAITPKTPGGFLPVTLASDLAQLPELNGAAGLGGAGLSVIEDGEPDGTFAVITDPAAISSVYELEFASGGWDGLRDTSLLISEDYAGDHDLVLGSTIDATFLNGNAATFTVGGIYKDDLFGNFLADRAAFADSGQPLFDFFVLSAPADGVSPDQAVSSIDTILANYPTAQAQTRAEFIDDQIGQLDGILTFIYALLFMSVFIAALGIVLTLLLAVYERRRELGLMRGIGTTRAQIRSSIRWEAVLTAVFGALMGLALGIGIGWIVVAAFEDQGLNTFSISPVSLIGFALLSIVLALLAALIPAQRAAKAPILEAIATT